MKDRLKTIGLSVFGAAVIGFIVYCFVLEVRSWALKEGVITYKHYQPAWTEIQSHSHGSHTVMHPERWTIYIEGIDDKGRKNRRRLHVSQAFFAESEIGATINVSSIY